MRSYLLLFVVFLWGCSTEQHTSSSTDDVHAIVNAYMSEHNYLGLAISAIKGDEVVFEQAYGFTDLNRSEAFSIDELVSLGSNTKTLTAASVLILQEQGRLNLSDKITKHLPVRIPWGDQLSINDLLCHTSGIPDIYGVGEFEDYDWQNAATHLELINKLSESNLTVESGIEYKYNNTAYFLLGVLVEHLSHQSLGDFYRTHLLKKEVSEHIYYLGDSFYHPILTNSFEKNGGTLTHYTSPVEYRVVAGAGGIGGDLKSYMTLFKAIQSGHLLSPNSTEIMHSPCLLKNGNYVVNGKGQQIGLGIEIQLLNGEVVYSRGGALNGYVSAVYYFSEKQLTVGIVGNTWAPLAPLLEELFDKNWHTKL